MRVVVETLNSTQVKLEIEVPSEQVNEAFEEAYKSLRGYASLPGFRKGRVPLALLKTRFSEHIKSEVVRQVVLPAYEDALYEKRLIPLEQPTFDPSLDKIEVSENQPFVFTATVSVKPTIQIPDYDQIQIDKIPVNVSREDVKGFIEKLQVRAATFDPIEEERPVNATDSVRIDWFCALEDRGLEDEFEQDLDIDLTQDDYNSDLKNGLIGMCIGETKLIEINYDDDHPLVALKGKRVIYSVTLHAITKKHLPQLDDEFAKDLGYETYNQLHGVIWNNLVEDERIKKIEEQKIEILEQLIEQTNITIPEELVDKYVQDGVQNVRRQLKEQHQTPEIAGVNFETLPTEIRKDVIRQTKQNWIFEEIANIEDFFVSDDELEFGIRQAADQQGWDTEKYVASLKANKRLENFRIQLQHEKIYQFLIENASEKKTLIITG